MGDKLIKKNVFLYIQYSICVIETQVNADTN